VSDPTPIGVFRDVQRPVHGESSHEELASAHENAGPAELETLLAPGDLDRRLRAARADELGVWPPQAILTPRPSL